MIRCAVGHAAAPVPTALPSGVLARTAGRKGILACTVPGQAPVPWPVGWKRGELRVNPRFPNPEPEAFIPSIVTCVMLWPIKKEKVNEERADAAELAAQSGLRVSASLARGRPSRWPALLTAEAPEPSRWFCVRSSTSAFRSEVTALIYCMFRRTVPEADGFTWNHQRRIE